MNRKRDIVELGDLYLENFKVEGVDEPNEFPKEKGADKKQKKAGPENADGVNKIADVPGKTDENDALNVKNLSDPKNRKVSKESGDDLGDDLGGDDELGGDDKVVVELSRECAAELHEVLMAKMGEDDLGDEMGDEGDLEDLDELEDGTLPEKVVSEPTPKQLHNHGLGQHPAGGNKGDMKAKAPGEPVANGTAETGNIDDDPSPKPLGSSDRNHPDVGSKKNKVDARKKNNPGAHMHGA